MTIDINNMLTFLKQNYLYVNYEPELSGLGWGRISRERKIHLDNFSTREQFAYILPDVIRYIKYERQYTDIYRLIFSHDELIQIMKEFNILIPEFDEFINIAHAVYIRDVHPLYKTISKKIITRNRLGQLIFLVDYSYAELKKLYNENKLFIMIY